MVIQTKPAKRPKIIVFKQSKELNPPTLQLLNLTTSEP